MWDLPRPGIESVSPVLAGGLFTTELPGKPPRIFFGKKRTAFPWPTWSDFLWAIWMLFLFFFFYVASTRGGVEGQVISVISSEPTQHTAARVPLLTTLIYTGPRKKRVLNPKLWFQLALACFTCTMYTSLSLSTFLLIFGLSHKWIPKSNRSEGKNTTI